MMIGILVGTVATAGLLTGDFAQLAKVALGAALIVYALFGLFAVRFTVRPDREAWLSPLVGLTTGLVAGVTGVFVIPAVPYLQALKLDREDLIQALGLSFTISTIALAGGLARSGVFAAPSLMGLSLFALAPALAGMFVGQVLRSRISPETFRRIFLVGLLFLGIYLIAEALFVHR